ncbi:MAG: NADH:flavin oxidoreductase/NADH oxidase [Alphaproteobacteria bacterium]|jgi:2,4-dienoyl-CoA reductase-like NADH-dependent reductase (Old Yellow Enzyme family)
MSNALFQPIQLRSVTLPNRIVVAPMCMYSADDGSATDWHVMHLGNLSQSGAGLLIVEATGIEARGRISPGCTGLYSDANEAAMKRVIDICRTYSDMPMGIQLGHAGRKASTNPPQKGGASLTEAEGAWETIGPSAEAFGDGWHTPRAMDRELMDEVIAAAVTATERCARIGFDVVELHGAHGYLVSEFLSPIANKRNDAFGGPIQNRIKFPMELFEAMRAAWPDDKPLGVRLNGTDWDDEGLKVEDAIVFAQALAGAGCDFLDVSGGGNSLVRPPLAPGYQAAYAAQIRAASGIPTMAVGMIREPQLANQLVESGGVDMIAMARGLLYEPRWPWRAAFELGADAPYAPQYGRAEPGKWIQAFPEVQQAAE